MLGFAARGENLARSTVLLVAYSLGLGVSFLAVGLAMGKLTRTLDWFKRHSRAITLVSAAILAVFGIVLLTDSLPTLDRSHVRRAALQRLRLARRRRLRASPPRS